MEWTIEHLLKRLQIRDECQRIEAKEAKRALGKSARETISAFSNEPGRSVVDIWYLGLSVMRLAPTTGI